jgi:hypothetical protein
MNNDMNTISKSVNDDPYIRKKFKNFIEGQTGYHLEYSNDGISISGIINSIKTLNTKNEEDVK